MKRRDLLASTASVAALATVGFGKAALAATVERVEVSEMSDAAVASLRKAVRSMRANHNAKDPMSWTYWWYIHYLPDPATPVPDDLYGVWNACLHHQNFFYPWHRGYLYFFEKALQKAANDPTLALPYWDYFANPVIPKIYADPTLDDGSPNPLYDDTRTLKGGQSVRKLDVYRRAFAGSVNTFPARSPNWRNVYEGEVDRGFHDWVHDQVGGDMGDQLASANDPIFYAHHCNIDRVWTAWELAAAGRQMPKPDYAPFWGRTFRYSSRKAPYTWTMSVKQMDDLAALGISYKDTTLPSVTPQVDVPPRPPVVRPLLAANALRPGELAATGGVALNASKTLAIPVSAPARAKLKSFAAAPASPAQVVLEGVQLTAAGRKGGYGYQVYVNLPPRGGTTANPEQYFIGSLGSFQLSVASHAHPGTKANPDISLPLSAALRAQARAKLLDADNLALSFVLQAGPGRAAASTPLITIARVHIDALGPP